MKPVVLVAGGSGGIGAAACRLLALANFTVGVGYSSNEAAAHKVAETTGGFPVRVDMRDPSSLSEAVRLASDGELPVAGLVLCSAPSPQFAPLVETSAETIDEHLSVSARGAHQLISELIRFQFRPQRKGTVVAVLSAAMGLGDRKATPGMGAYIIGKYSLLGVLKAAAADYPWLVVRSIAPDFVETRMLDSFDPRFLELARAGRPQGRFATPEEVAVEIVSAFIAAP